MTSNSTLYYPTIEFANPHWLWTASILWDHIYRIVPENYSPADSNNIKELLSSSDIIHDINPTNYASNAFSEFKQFMKDNKKAWAAALESGNLHDEQYVKMHKDKVDVRLKQTILAQNGSVSDFLDVPSDIANFYMMFLAENIAKQNNLHLSTDKSEAWCARNFFDFDGNIDSRNYEEDETYLCAITFNHMVPNEIINLTPNELVNFRNTSRNERHIFFEDITNLKTSLEACNDPIIISDIINDHILDLTYSRKLYKQRCNDIFVSHFFGLKTMVVPIAIPVLNAFSTLPDSLKSALDILGVGIGVIGSTFNISKEIKAARSSYPVNYLFELNQRCMNPQMGCLEVDCHNIFSSHQAFLHEDLNHFIYD